MNSTVDAYLAAGCGRCPLGNTPDCKVHNWREELENLRSFVLDCGLTEEVKWGVPCYTFEGKNILIVAALKDYCAVSFFKGSLLKDLKGLLVSPGENSQAAKMFRFTDVRKILEMEPVVKAYIHEAVEVEKAGLKVPFKPISEHKIPEELQKKLDEDPAFSSAFNALTPGRQRGYIIHFSQPKQSKTREARIEKYMPQIFNGIGMHDQYRSMRQ
ncbi:MAG: YdeI/OmpD-associated family protein [Pyrinomonadaceae bacterium]